MFAHTLREPYTSHVDGFARERLPPPQWLPEFRFDLPELQYPERINCGVVLIDDAVREGHGERIALYSDHGNWTYTQLLESAAAFVVLHDGNESSPELAKTLQTFVKENIAPYKYPRVIEFRTSLPKAATGKLQRHALRTT